MLDVFSTLNSIACELNRYSTIVSDYRNYITNVRETTYLCQGHLYTVTRQNGEVVTISQAPDSSLKLDD